MAGKFRFLPTEEDFFELFEEIAGIIGGSVESVRTRLCRARRSLREKLRPYLEEEET